MDPKQSRSRRLRWIALAALLLVLGALVLSLGEREPAPTTRTRVDFPSHMRPAEEERARARATLVLPQAPGPGPAQAEPPRRDPFLVSLPVTADRPVVVLEANALRHSRLGERLVACLLARDPDTFAKIEREIGVDPLKDVDRVGFAGDSVVVSGFFDRMRRDQLERNTDASSYGDGGRLYRQRGGGSGPAIATWGDGLVLMGDEASLRRSIDQLEGRAPAPETGIPEDMAYGEAYGVVPGTAVQRLFGQKDPELAQRIAAAASRVEFHVDAMNDVASVVRVRGDDGAGLSDIARSIGGALAAARVEAQARDDRRMAELLEHARVLDDKGSFSVEMALAGDRVEQLFEGCEKAGEPRPAPPAPAGQP
ncbi:MAG: hypothetical protein QM704_06335 [Anaeromyxobacteraceae bacterium]